MTDLSEGDFAAANAAALVHDTDMVPTPGRVTVASRRRLKVLAAQMDTTAGRLTDVAFRRGLDILEAEQREREAAEEAAEEKAE
jgi:hypothetical protein